MVSFTLDEVSECISSLKQHKAAGPDAIEPEYLIYGGETQKVHLAALFNAIVAEEYIPEAFQLGMVIPIPKGYKDLSVPGNYRGITILSNVSKVFEKLLLLKISQQSSPPHPQTTARGLSREPWLHSLCPHSAGGHSIPPRQGEESLRGISQCEESI